MTIAELKEMIDNNDWDIKYSRFGIRIQEQPLNSALWTTIQRCGLTKKKPTKS